MFFFPFIFRRANLSSTSTIPKEKKRKKNSPKSETNAGSPSCLCTSDRSISRGTQRSQHGAWKAKRDDDDEEEEEEEVEKDKEFVAAVATTGGSCSQSPHSTSWIPPKGLSLLLTARAAASSASNSAAETIDTSSTIRTRQLLQRAAWRGREAARTAAAIPLKFVPPKFP